MKERNWFVTNWKEILKAIALLVVIVGAFVFGKYVLKVSFSVKWKLWLAVVLGELSYLYSVTFFVAGVFAALGGFDEKHRVSLAGLGTAIVLVGVATIIQLAFWGVVLSCTKALIAIAVTLVIVSIPIVGFLLRRL
ncbi:MAG: hypothetical protein ACI4VN_06535 [Clostridia bacterium]